MKRWAIEGPDGGRYFFSDYRQQAIDKLIHHNEFFARQPGDKAPDWPALMAQGYKVAKTGGGKR